MINRVILKKSIGTIARSFSHESPSQIECHVCFVRRYFQPVVNPDGYEYSHTTDRLWRKNRSAGSGFLRCAGVDLNRNYGYQFGGTGTSTSRCSEIYRGAGAFSEPETLAHKRFFEQTKEQFKAFLTFHSYGQYILYPWGYNTAVPVDHVDLERIGTIAANVRHCFEEFIEMHDQR